MSLESQAGKAQTAKLSRASPLISAHLGVGKPSGGPLPGGDNRYSKPTRSKGSKRIFSGGKRGAEGCGALDIFSPRKDEDFLIQGSRISLYSGEKRASQLQQLAAMPSLVSLSSYIIESPSSSPTSSEFSTTSTNEGASTLDMMLLQQRAGTKEVGEGPAGVFSPRLGMGEAGWSSML